VKDDIKKIEPRQVWLHFDQIRQIPHGSRNEKELGEYIISAAKKSNLEWHRDEVGNILIKKPASKGKEKVACIVLQGHLDMVNEKNSDVVHNFEQDPLQLKIFGDYLMAQGTTLGADNGVGVAVALAIMQDRTVHHGPLEILFTIDEETGLTGANNLKPGLIKSKRLINLDTEEDGSIYIGCAGGADSTIKLRLKMESVPKDTVFVKIKVQGLRGGHSGVDIHEERGNAIKIIARILCKVNETTKLNLIDIFGGNKRNAIPREAEALIAVNKKEFEFVEKTIVEIGKALKCEYAKKDKDLKITVQKMSRIDRTRVIAINLSRKIVNLLNALPHGVLAMSMEMPGLVETSTNLAVISVTDNVLTIGINSRSSVATSLRATLDRIKSIAELANFRVEFGGGYPGWKPNPDSSLLKLAKNVYRDLYKVEPATKAIHAGLECGIIGEKFPGIDMISIGPQIENPHSPAERVKISTVAKFWEFLIHILERL
jgi:dipeptidase D